MSSGAASATDPHDHDALGRARVVRIASAALFAVLPAVTVVVLFAGAMQDDADAFDFRPVYRAAGAILDGRTPYPATGVPLTAESGQFVYPPLVALVATPLHVLSIQAADLAVMALLVVVAAAVPFVLGVRDWRCYGLLYLWPPVLAAIQTGNVTLWFALAAALAWRFKNWVLVAAASVGLTVAVKLFLWPLVVWFVATRRFASAVVATVVGAGLLLASWAAIGFAGFLDYPELLRKLETTVGDDSYTAYVVGLEAGLPSPVSRTIWLGLGLAILACVVVVGLRGDERSAFILAIGASLALTPIVWLHYFALILVAVAVAYPRLGFAWFIPLALVLTPGSGHHTTFQAAWTLTVAAAVLVLCVRSSLADRGSFARPTLRGREGLEARG